MDSASSRDTHTTSCSIPQEAGTPTFCQGKRVGHRWPGCLSLPTTVSVDSPRSTGAVCPPPEEHGMDSCRKLVYTQILTQPHRGTPPSSASRLFYVED